MRMRPVVFTLPLLFLANAATAQDGTLRAQVPGNGSSVPVEIAPPGRLNFVSRGPVPSESIVSEFQESVFPAPGSRVELLRIENPEGQAFWLDGTSSSMGQRGLLEVRGAIEARILNEHEGRCGIFESHPSLMGWLFAGATAFQLQRGVRTLSALIEELVAPEDRSSVVIDRPVNTMSCARSSGGYDVVTLFFIDATPFAAPETLFHAVLVSEAVE